MLSFIWYSNVVISYAVGRREEKVEAVCIV
jgi:hypothetical protein